MTDDRSGLTIRGGGSIRVSRSELDRVRSQVELAQSVMHNELGPLANLGSGAILLAIELPGILQRLDAIKNGCLLASEQYFGGEHAIASRINAIERVDVPALAGRALGSANRLGLLREGKIEISRTGFAGGISAPHSVVELALRLQRTSADGDAGDQAEFRIERFGHRVIVYIPGTKEWSVKAGENPLDVTSNVHAMADSAQVAASERAVLAAMRSARVGAGDEVLLVGHSQGGIIAANIAADQHAFKVSGIVTFGAPIATADIAPSTNVIALEHTNDPVPMLDGGPNAIRENWLTVRERFNLDAGQSPVAVHDLAGYVETAGRFDASRSVRASEALEFIREFAGRRAGRTEWYSARRLAG